MTKLPARGLYAITPSAETSVTKRHHQAVGSLENTSMSAILGGAVMVQYRDTGGESPRRRAEAAALLRLCRSHRVPLIINDDVELARDIGANGVHVGKDDAPVAVARAVLGPHAIIGASCYNSLDKATEAQDAGADYVAFGSFFPSLTKPAAVRASTSLLTAAKRIIRVPIVAIGGITPENGSALLDAGADLLAVVQGVFGQQDPETAARRYADLF